MPLFDLTAGMKNTQADSGAILGAGVSLPLFNRNQDELLRANAELAILNAQRTLLVTRARGEVGGLAAEARELRNAARLFREQALPTSERLTATAEAAYRAGEVGILELLDAYRTALDAEVEAAELEQRAREAEIELTRALGGIRPMKNHETTSPLLLLVCLRLSPAASTSTKKRKRRSARRCRSRTSPIARSCSSSSTRSRKARSRRSPRTSRASPTSSRSRRER